MFVDAMHEAAVKTLEAAGYTYHGGELWKPPLGPSAKPFLDRIAELEAALRGVIGWAGAHASCGAMSDPEEDVSGYEQAMARAEAALRPASR